MLEVKTPFPGAPAYHPPLSLPPHHQVHVVTPVGVPDAKKGEGVAVVHNRLQAGAPGLATRDPLIAKVDLAPPIADLFDGRRGDPKGRHVRRPTAPRLL